MKIQPLNTVVAGISRFLLGKEHEIRLAMACLLARGHLLIEDIPGVGKTTLAEGRPGKPGRIPPAHPLAPPVTC